MANVQDFAITKGKTFHPTLRWGAPPIVYKPISAIPQSAPATLTVTGHGMIDGWACAVTAVQGMTQINAAHTPPMATEYVQGTVVDANTIELNSVNAAGFDLYETGGYIQYLTPVDLTGMIARMMIKDSKGNLLATLTTENGGVTLNNTTKTIQLLISATDTALLTVGKHLYDLEMESSTGVVDELCHGKIVVTAEITA